MMTQFDKNEENNNASETEEEENPDEQEESKVEIPSEFTFSTAAIAVVAVSLITSIASCILFLVKYYYGAWKK